MRSIFFVAAAGLLSAVATGAQVHGKSGITLPSPPVVKAEPVIDAYQSSEPGVPAKITDPYRWLEDAHSPETRAYIIHTPASYKGGKDAYPVLVLQDAEAHFAHTTSAVDLLSGSGRIPPMIVVGIDNTDRTRDMTPSKPSTGFGGTPWTGSAGGADKFLSFILT